MDNQGNDYDLLLGNHELEGDWGNSGFTKSGAPVEFLVELQWKLRRSSGRISSGAPVDVRIRGLSEDPLRSGAVVRELGKLA
jgi:hypothetical protein